MRKTFIFALLVLFCANTVVVSAWAQPCMHHMNHSGSTVQADMEDCHQTDDMMPQPENSHCDNQCWCAHVFHAPSLLLNANHGFTLPVLMAPSFIIDNDALASISHIPPQRPPKHIC